MSLANPIELHPRPEYRADVVARVSHRPTETTETGARIYSELVTFSDSIGRTVVRELTLAEANPNLPFNPYPIVETDPWTTGAEGLNRDKIRNYSKLGSSVVWLHHAGKESPIGPDKSISRSAHQIHALLDSLQYSSKYDTQNVVGSGYSRGAMTMEKFIAVASDYARVVPVSDTEAPCFVRDMSALEQVRTLMSQAPRELVGIAHIAVERARLAIKHKEPGMLLEWAKTFDLDARNVIQEGLWIPALINSNVGTSISDLPKNTQGVRNFFKGDIMSQLADHEVLYRNIPGIQIVERNGPHVMGARQEYLQTKYTRMGRIAQYIADHQTIDGITAQTLTRPVYSTKNTIKVVKPFADIA